MTTYKVGEQVFAIIDNELWFKIAPLESTAPKLSEEPLAESRQSIVGKKRGRTVGLSIKSNSRKSRISDEIRRSVIDEYKGGYTTIDGLAKKYKIGYGTVYNICKVQSVSRAKGNSGKPLKVSVRPQKFICPQDHHFESKFPITHARCPQCRQLAALEDVELPVVET